MNNFKHKARLFLCQQSIGITLRCHPALPPVGIYSPFHKGSARRARDLFVIYFLSSATRRPPPLGWEGSAVCGIAFFVANNSNIILTTINGYRPALTGRHLFTGIAKNFITTLIAFDIDSLFCFIGDFHIE
jgi:hypothetical protein